MIEEINAWLFSNTPQSVLSCLQITAGTNDEQHSNRFTRLIKIWLEIPSRQSLHAYNLTTTFKVNSIRFIACVMSLMTLPSQWTYSKTRDNILLIDPPHGIYSIPLDAARSDKTDPSIPHTERDIKGSDIPLRMTDTDGDGRGDVCDLETCDDEIDNDGDGDYDEPLECEEEDDVCDAGGDGIDNDGDGQIDEPGEDFPPRDADQDNCQHASNPDQEDADGNGRGDVCDADRDGDGIPDDEDNCPEIENTDRKSAVEGKSVDLGGRRIIKKPEFPFFG